MINAATLIGEPLSFKNICLIYPPKVKDVVANPAFHTYYKVLTLTQDELVEECKKRLGDKSLENEIIDPFEFLINCCYNNIDFKKITEEAFQFFLHEPVLFLYEEKKILIGSPESNLPKAKNVKDLPFLDESNYFDFQNAIRNSYGVKPIQPPEPVNLNEDPRIRRMKEKIRERDRIKAKAAAEGKSTGGISLSTSLAAICCMGIGLTPLNIGELSYASIGPIMNMMQEKEKYDVDIRSLLAGADSKKVKPKYWIRNTD